MPVDFLCLQKLDFFANNLLLAGLQEVCDMRWQCSYKNATFEITKSR